ncbi:MAG: hypothetical protein AAF590_05990 [Pseudomonadota bacterium]
MFPFLSNTNNFEYPLSGDVNQDISTSFFAAMKGIPEIEKEAVSKVASYGDQLGALTAVVLQLVEKSKLESAKVDELKTISDEIKKVKDAHKKALKIHAETALRRLKKADPDAYKAVFSEAKDNEA